MMFPMAGLESANMANYGVAPEPSF